jgi:HlyD family secretion protein
MNSNTSEIKTPISNPSPVPGKKKNVVVPAIVGVVLLLGIGLFLRSKGGSENKAEPVAGAQRGPQIRTVKVVPVTTGTIVENLAITGQLRSNQNVDLNAKISGRVARVLVQEGQRVSRGQLLVQLDEEDLRQAVDSARANLQSAQVRLEQTKLNLPSRIAQLNSAVDSARAALRNNEAAVNAAKAGYQSALLNEPAAITNTRSQVDTAKAGVASAEARLKTARDTARQTEGQVNAGISGAEAALAQARAQLEQVRNGSRDQEINRATAAVRLAEAQLRDAETNLNRQKILFDGGATAKANVDTATTQYSVAQANLDAARQDLSLVREGARTEEVRAAEEVVSQREASLRSAQADRNRVLAAQSQVSEALAGVSTAQQGLRQAQANLAQIPITRQETRTALEQVRQAEAQANSARVALQQAQVNVSQIPGLRADVPAAQAAVNSAQAALNQAQLNLSYARITSPVNGVVTAKNTDIGESAAPGASLLSLVALDSVYFEAQVPETQLSRIRVGQPARITVNAVSNTPVVGYVSDIIPVADERLRQFRIRITLPQGKGMTPGAFARGNLQLNVVSNTLTLPNDVIRTENGKTFVYVAVEKGDKAEIKKRTVRVGGSANGKSQVMGAINDGDQVVVGTATLDEGTEVKISKSNA